MANIKIEKLSSFRVQQENANSHTERGLEALDTSYSEVGYVAPMTSAANGEMLDGSARLERAIEQFPDAALVIRHDGSKPVVMVREDVKDADNPKAKQISYKANRIGEIDLAWNPDQILKDIENGIDLSGLFSEDELGVVTQAIPDIDFKEYDETIKDEVEYIECPHCGEKFPK